MVAVLLCLSGPAAALTEGDLRDQGYQPLTCLFDQRCVIGQPCERAWREFRWLINDDTGSAYAVRDQGKIGRKLPLMQDARWKARSDARAILMPMREAVAGHLTVFDGGGAVYSVQYAGNPGDGQTFLGQCEVGMAADQGAENACTLVETCDGSGACADRSVTLRWRDDPDTLRIDDTRAGVSRLDGAAALANMRVGDTDLAIRANGPTLFLTGKDLSGIIIQGTDPDTVIAQFLSLPDQRGDASDIRRTFSGQCEALF
ncbi:hypothetical protein [Tateyamaria omphalii]|nr:hypothetical protein [Tateyamaria omphalii]